MTVIDYLEKLKEICKHECISETKLVRELDIAHNTLLRIRRRPESCSMNTMKKFKMFIDKWETKNMKDNHGTNNR